MRIVLEVTSGVQAGRKVWLQPGQTLTVGRLESADLAFAGDSQMSHEHFVVECLEHECRLRDLGSTNGTTVNGQRIARANLADGDTIVAGETIFTVSTEGASAVSAREDGADEVEPDVPLEVIKERLIEYFRQLPEPLFAVLDAARDPLVLALLIQSDHQYQSLYEGPKGERLAAVAPYLVSLPPDSPLLETLVPKGWGDSWGIYLTCDKPFKEVRKHFRQFLIVQTEEGKKLYFRFYDPRVLRVFFPTCLTKEVVQFFGPIGSFYVEGERPKNLLRFPAEEKGAAESVRFGLEPVVVGSQI